MPHIPSFSTFSFLPLPFVGGGGVCAGGGVLRGRYNHVNTMNLQGKVEIYTSAVVCRLFRKLVNLLQKMVGYRLPFIQSSDLYFLSIHAILL